MVQRKKKGEFNMSCLIRYNPAGSILLPQGYTRLAYIEGNADAWFSAGIAATANTKYKIKFSAKNKGSWNMMFGRWNNCVIGINSSMHLYINGSDVGVIEEDEICDVTASSSAVYFKSKNSITCNKVSAHPVKLAVFGGTGDSDTDNPWGYGKGRIYELKIWEGNTLIRDYVPAKNSSGVAGLLDLVDNSWHPSSTSTQFKAGPEIPQGFPTSEYCQVEWLESTGTQWVDTDTVTTSNLQLDLEFQLTNNAVYDTKLFGTESAGQYYNIYCGDDGNNIKGYSKINTSNSYAAFGPKDQNKHTIIYNRYSDRKCLFDGVVKFTMSEDSTTGTQKAKLFYSDGGSIKAQMKLYVCKLYNSGTLIKNFIPCYRRSDMKPGLYDIVGRKFYINQGTGEFLLGPSITFGYGEIVNNVGAEAHPMLGTQYTETNKFTHIGKNKDDFIALPVYQRVEPGQQISISFDTDVTQWASRHGYAGGINKGKWTMWIYFYKTYNINKGWDLPVCYAASQIKSLGGTRWKYSFTVPADMHMIRVRTNLYSDGSTSYTAHFWNFNWSFGDTGCQVNPLHAIPHNISTGDGRNGEKNGAFHFDGTSYMEVDVGSILPANCTKYTIMMWAKADISSTCALFSQRNQIVATGRCVLQDNTHMDYDDGVRRNFSHGVTRNNWNHYAFVRNGSNKYVYINGKLVNISSASTAEAFSPVLTIGACQTINSGVIQQFVGDMKDIKVFDTNLDASRIQQEM